MRDTVIKVEDLTIAYHDKPVLWDIDLEIPKASMTAVVGPNGAGKSTLIKSILGLVPKSSGFVKVNNHDVKSELKNIAYVPQSGSVDWDFPTNVLDVVTMGTYGRLGWFKRPGKNEKKLALEALEKVGMTEFRDRQISKLSGGQQQRVFLARALVQDADIYFLDEPLKGVDALTEKTIMTILNNLRDEGKTIVVVHHDLRTVKTYFDQVVLLNVKVIAHGKVEEEFTDENIAKAYGYSRGDLDE